MSDKPEISDAQRGFNWKLVTRNWKVPQSIRDLVKREKGQDLPEYVPLLKREAIDPAPVDGEKPPEDAQKVSNPKV